MLRTLLGIVASPLIFLALLLIGVLAALAHLAAMPALYLWELLLERNPWMGRASHKESAPTREGHHRR